MNVFNNIPLRIKIMGNAALLMTLVLILAGSSIISMSLVGGELHRISNNDMPLVKGLTKITEHQLEQYIHFERGMRFGLALLEEPDAAYEVRKESEYFRNLTSKIEKEISEVSERAHYSLSHAESKMEKDEFHHVIEALELIQREHLDFDHHAMAVFSKLEQGLYHEVEADIVKVEHEGDELDEQLEALLSELEIFTHNGIRVAEEHEGTAVAIQIVLTILALCIGIGSSWLISSNIVNRIKTAGTSLEIITTGDLTKHVSVDGKDEIGDLLQSVDTMQNKLIEMLKRISSTSQELASTSEEVSATMEQTAANTQEQQVATDIVSNSMAEITQALEDVATKVSETSIAAENASAETLKGQEVVYDTVEEIKVLASQIDETTNVIIRVEKSSEEISTVLEVIRSIADQTNLLALNAAIEAARAGEQGRGFAVVADEVRTLAGRTQESTIQINDIIEKLQSETKTASKSMASSRDKSHSVVQKATLAGSTLQVITESVEEINLMSTQIAAATVEQRDFVRNTQGSVNKIRDMSQDNAASVEQVTVAGHELAKLASKLQSLVDQFRIA